MPESRNTGNKSSAPTCQKNGCGEEAMPYRNYCSTACFREAVRGAGVV